MLTSQPHDRFERHVGFDNVPIGESSKKVPSSVVLTVKHNGYQPRRRSRTFMVGIDENPYSEYAVQWLLDELVDDGDEIICVRVIEKDMRLTEKSYYSDAQQVMDSIMAKNGSNRAVAFILEYAVGKLHSTFQSLVSTSSYENLFFNCLPHPTTILTICKNLDPALSASHANCGHPRTISWRPPRTRQQSQLVFQVLSAVLSRTCRRR